jgi:hypothetical protein
MAVHAVFDALWQRGYRETEEEYPQESYGAEK